MIRKASVKPRRFKVFGPKDIDSIRAFRHLDPQEIHAMKVVASVLPFRVNEYVLEELIRWEDVPDDPIYQLTIPQEGMLEKRDFERISKLMRHGAGAATIRAEARRIQVRMNPHPAGQVELNVPRLHGRPLPGFQHKYRETVLFFPSQGQTCHSYCTYCFRWAQFVGLDDLKFASREAEHLAEYVRSHPEVSSVLFTGGDPLVMKTSVLRRYVEPLLAPDLEHLRSIRIGTKAPAYWPYRFLTDPDADDLLRLFEQVNRAGKHIAIMAHYSHAVELSTRAAGEALRRIHATGSIVRTQAPVIRRVNDSSLAWADLWREQVRLGAVPYYMFVERDTGPKNYFEVPLARAFEIFERAYRRVSGLARTVRGPSMSATPGKVLVDGIAQIADEKIFVLKFLQAREPTWVNRPFFAKFDPKATWLSQLSPALGKKEFFFSEAIRRIRATRKAPAWGEPSDGARRGALFGHVEWE